MNKSAVALILLFIVGCIVVVSGLVTGRPSAPVEAPVATPRASAPEPSVRPAKRERTAPVAATPAKQEPAAAAVMEARFTDLREEGRRLRQLTDSDPETGLAFQNAYQNPEYRALTGRRHELERAWAGASDAEKETILAEMNALRERTMGMVMMELAKLRAAPAAAAPVVPASRPEASQRTDATPADATKGPAAPAPVVIM